MLTIMSPGVCMDKCSELLLAGLGSVCSAMAEKLEYLMVPLELEKLQCM